jgi:hypothetical protein
LTFSAREENRRPLLSLTTGIGVAMLLAALGLLGCGSGSTDSDTTSTVGNYVGARNLNQYKRGTPQRTVLQWWKAVQFGNPSVVHSYYAPGAGPGLHDLQRELAAASNQFSGIPNFNSAEIHKGTATLYFFVTRPESSTPPRPVSINLVNKDGEWGLADDQLLSQVVERVNRAQPPAS